MTGGVTRLFFITGDRTMQENKEMTLDQAIRYARDLVEGDMPSVWTAEETKQLLEFLEELKASKKVLEELQQMNGRGM